MTLFLELNTVIQMDVMTAPFKKKNGKNDVPNTFFLKHSFSPATNGFQLQMKRRWRQSCRPILLPFATDGGRGSRVGLCPDLPANVTVCCQTPTSTNTCAGCLTLH